MRIKISEYSVLLQLPLDVFSVGFSFSIVFFRKTSGILGGFEYVPDYQSYFPFVIAIACLQLIIFASFRLYSFHSRSFLKELGVLVYSFLIWSGSVLALLFISKQFYFSRLLLGSAIIIFFLISLFTRIILRSVRRIFYRLGVGHRGVVIVGSGNQALYLAEYLDKLAGFKLLGLVKENDFSSESLEEIFARWYNDRHKVMVDEVWNAGENLQQNVAEELFDFCADRKIIYRYVPTFFESSARSADAMFVGDYPLMEVIPTPLRGWGKVAKRLVDIIGSSIGLVLLSPIFLIVAVLIKIFSPGPIFVGLKRVGYKKYKQPFTMFKFRSMIVGAHAMKAQLMHLNERKGGPLFKLKNDPRITPIGKYLRKFRIDELPQLWNVLLGQMSLVGPRAHEPEEVAKYSQKQLRLLRVKPGMTGMGQVGGASDLSFDEEVKLETYYIQNWSLWLDMQILLRTIWAVINRKGAA